MILITGATGTVGRHVVAEVVRAGLPARVLVRSPEKGAPLEGPGVELAIGDLHDPSSLADALDGVERMFLLTPIAPDLPAVERAAIDAAKAAGVRQIVKLGARGAAG